MKFWIWTFVLHVDAKYFVIGTIFFLWPLLAWGLFHLIATPINKYLDQFRCYVVMQMMDREIVLQDDGHISGTIHLLPERWRVAETIFSFVDLGRCNSVCALDQPIQWLTLTYWVFLSRWTGILSTVNCLLYWKIILFQVTIFPCSTNWTIYLPSVQARCHCTTQTRSKSLFLFVWFSFLSGNLVIMTAIFICAGKIHVLTRMQNPKKNNGGRTLISKYYTYW